MFIFSPRYIIHDSLSEARVGEKESFKCNDSSRKRKLVLVACVFQPIIDVYIASCEQRASMVVVNVFRPINVL